MLILYTFKVVLDHCSKCSKKKLMILCFCTKLILEYLGFNNLNLDQLKVSIEVQSQSLWEYLHIKYV